VAYAGDCIGFLVDWLSFRVESLAEALDWYEGATGLNPMELEWCIPRHGYDFGYAGPFGLRIYYSDSDCLVVMSGETCSAFGYHAVIGAIDRAVKVTRIDIARECEFGSVVPKLRDAVNEHRVMGAMTFRVERNPQGQTVYMGSRQSSVFVRAYDRRGWDRVEVECKGEASSSVVSMIRCGMTLAQVWAGLMSRFSVREAPGAHRYRSAVSAWFSDLLTAFVQVVSSSTVKMSAERVVDNIRRQWGSKIQSLREVFEDWEILGMIADGTKKLRGNIIWKSEQRFIIDAGMSSNWCILESA
jgi:hypothetical protein